MHGAGGVGGHKLHQHALAAAEVGAAVAVALRGDFLHDSGVIPRAQEEIDKSGTGNFAPVKVGVVQRQPGAHGLGDFARRHAQCAGGRHGEVGGVVAVGGVAGDFDGERRNRLRRERAVCDGFAHGVQQGLL